MSSYQNNDEKTIQFVFKLLNQEFEKEFVKEQQKNFVEVFLTSKDDDNVSFEKRFAILGNYSSHIPESKYLSQSNINDILNVNVELNHIELAHLEIQIDDYEPGLWQKQLELHYESNKVGSILLELNFLLITEFDIKNGKNIIQNDLRNKKSKISEKIRTVRESNLRKLSLKRQMRMNLKNILKIDPIMSKIDTPESSPTHIQRDVSPFSYSLPKMIGLKNPVIKKSSPRFKFAKTPLNRLKNFHKLDKQQYDNFKDIEKQQYSKQSPGFIQNPKQVDTRQHDLSEARTTKFSKMDRTFFNDVRNQETQESAIKREISQFNHHVQVEYMEKKRKILESKSLKRQKEREMEKEKLKRDSQSTKLKRRYSSIDMRKSLIQNRASIKLGNKIENVDSQIQKDSPQMLDTGKGQNGENLSSIEKDVPAESQIKPNPNNLLKSTLNPSIKKRDSSGLRVLSFNKQTSFMDNVSAHKADQKSSIPMEDEDDTPLVSEQSSSFDTVKAEELKPQINPDHVKDTLKDQIKKFNHKNTIYIGDLKIKYKDVNVVDGKLSFIPGKSLNINYSYEPMKKNQYWKNIFEDKKQNQSLQNTKNNFNKSFDTNGINKSKISNLYGAANCLIDDYERSKSTNQQSSKYENKKQKNMGK